MRPTPDAGKVRTFAEIYRQAKASGMAAPVGTLALGPRIGEELPFFPVVIPPRVVKVWVPAHTAEHDMDVLVAGHWTFLMVEEARWYIEDEAREGRRRAPLMPYGPAKE